AYSPTRPTASVTWEKTTALWTARVTLPTPVRTVQATLLSIECKACVWLPGGTTLHRPRRRGLMGILRGRQRGCVGTGGRLGWRVGLTWTASTAGDAVWRICVNPSLTSRPPLPVALLLLLLLLLRKIYRYAPSTWTAATSAST
ncbi:hypothetical protein FOZ63_018618, partial [Perkinsus olseni]